MRQLIVLSEEGNFTRAAQALGMTQPALSRAVQSLEEETGLRLFDRTATGAIPTAAGTELVREARRIVGSIDLVEHNLRLGGRGDVGQVDFAAGPLAANYLLTRILSRALVATPQLAITAVVRETSAIIEGVLDGTFDFGVCSSSTFAQPDAISAQPIGSLQMGLFVRAGHPLLALGRALTWEDLRPFPRATGRHPNEMKVQGRDAFDPLDTTVECNDFDVLHKTTLVTDTVWMTGAALVESDIRAGRLAEIVPAPVRERPLADILLVRQTGRTLSPAAKRVIEVALTAAI